MKKSYNHIEDFITDESFRNWVNNPSSEMNEYWENWLNNNPDKRDLFDESIELIRSLEFKSFEAEKATKERILQDIKKEIPGRQKSIPVLQKWYAIAATLLLIALFIYVNPFEWGNSEDGMAEQSWVTKSNKAGVKSQLVLPDGSKVYLNSGSSIQYPQSFSDSLRLLKMSGEAYFDVTHDPDRPFKIQSEGFDITVLGTSFNVNTKAEQAKVALVEGKVRLSSQSDQSSIDLNPGQMALFSKSSKSFELTNFDEEMVTAWKEGKLIFQEASFTEVLDQLHWWYGVEVEVINPQQTTDWSYTATFNNQSLERVLLNMSTMRDFEYEIRNDSLFIRF